MDLFVMKIKERLEDATLSFSERAKVRCGEPVHLCFGMLDCYIKIQYHKSLMHVLIMQKFFETKCLITSSNQTTQVANSSKFPKTALFNYHSAVKQP